MFINNETEKKSKLCFQKQNRRGKERAMSNVIKVIAARIIGIGAVIVGAIVYRKKFG